MSTQWCLQGKSSRHSTCSQLPAEHTRVTYKDVSTGACPPGAGVFLGVPADAQGSGTWTVEGLWWEAGGTSWQDVEEWHILNGRSRENMPSRDTPCR